MKLINTVDAVGHVLAHDHTQILPGDKNKDGSAASGSARFKSVRFKKGHKVAPEDIDVLLSMGKEHLYVFELEPGMLHEDDAAERLAALCLGEGTQSTGEPHEGKMSIRAAHDGCFVVDSERLVEVNSQPDVMVATRKGGYAVTKGDELAGTRVIPLVVSESVVEAAERAVNLVEKGPLMYVAPWKVETAAIIATGSEVKKGLIVDKFTPVVERKLAAYGVKTIARYTPGDNMEDLVATISEARATGAGMICCTGGMSVDPDDNTPGAIKRSGANIVTYGAPVLPGAMMLVGYFGEDPTSDATVPIVGLPGCVMYNDATIFDLLLPRLIAKVPITRALIARMGEGGLCLKCDVCTFPHCPFGK